ncbi:Txe/YoeB family addiction module toxin [Muribaculaceae bacterium Isolate-083 (Janvier)]|nr:Txe/YoeB family addiction module toxin [Lactobacillus sp.]ROS93565.1 Txe/YoeB family addiction module toxin [Muribaculaceae bacterium Isolate-077 (Janvier)]ROS94262.1 Txe/YoeB family addiction module toxin [Muribaculaceae bacterium Isolate-083 (Janvier)]ROS96694.1 Txe/YoeB family addiction module toxin [Muribaculaceae bacterium Isolate-084 (Janvier)]
MTYELILSDEATQHLIEWRKSGQKKTLKKISNLFEELKEHPKTGTGHVEQLKGNLSGLWSREINKGDRMIYGIEDDKVIVNVVSLKGHYGDK